MTKKCDLNTQMENLEIGDLLMVNYGGRNLGFPVLDVVVMEGCQQYIFAHPNQVKLRVSAVLPHRFTWNRERQTFVAACCGQDEFPRGCKFSILKEDFAHQMAMLMQQTARNASPTQ